MFYMVFGWFSRYIKQELLINVLYKCSAVKSQEKSISGQNLYDEIWKTHGVKKMYIREPSTLIPHGGGGCKNSVNLNLHKEFRRNNSGRLEMNSGYIKVLLPQQVMFVHKSFWISTWAFMVKWRAYDVVGSAWRCAGGGGVAGSVPPYGSGWDGGVVGLQEKIREN